MSASSLLPPPPPSPSSTKLKRGSLYKQRDFRSGWPTRLFVLDPPLLHYYIDPNDASPRKSIYVVNCSITANQPDGTPQPAISDNNNTLYPFQISHPSTTKTYNLACGSKEERDDWVRALTKAAQPTPIPATPDADSPPKPPPSLKNAASLITSAARTLKINPHYVTSVPSHFHPLLESTMQKLRDLASADLPRTDQPALTGPVPWKPLFEKKGVVAAILPGTNVTVRGDATMPHHPFQVLNTVMNVLTKSKFDNQFDTGSRIATYNNHTFADYLKFQKVWPTSVRDLTNLSHWRVEDGIIKFITFSVTLPAAPEIKGHVRAHCLIGGWEIAPVTKDDGTVHSKVKVIVCSDLKGSLPGNVVAQVTQQQAMFPVIISKYLQETEPTPPRRLAEGEITNEGVIESVIKHLPKELQGAPPPLVEEEVRNEAAAPLVARAPSPSAAAPSPTAALAPSPTSDSLGVHIPTSPVKGLDKPSLAFSSLALFLPVILWGVAKYYLTSLAPLRGFMFIVGLAAGLRIFATRRLGEAMSYTDGSSVGLCGNGNGGTGAVTCSFSVDLKKMMRYIETRRTTARRSCDKKAPASEIAVTHIALKACALVLNEMALFNGRAVRLPLLGINGYYPNATVDVSTSAGRPENGTKRIVKLVDAHLLGVGEISTKIKGLLSVKMASASVIGKAILPSFIRGPLEILSEQLDLCVPGLGLDGRNFGSALVVTSPNQTEGSEVAVTVAPMPPPAQKAGGPQIIVIVGGVQILPAFAKQPGSAVARPVLNVSVTIDCGVANVATCRMFAERLQAMMKEPERMETIVKEKRS